MIQDVAQRTGHMNCDKVTDALKNATDRLISTKYMNSGMGDGGGCHPRDNIALRHLSQKLDLPYDIFSAVMLARDGQARAIAEYLWGLAQAINTPHVIIMGKSFKPNVTDSTGSASVLVYCNTGLCPGSCARAARQPKLLPISVALTDILTEGKAAEHQGQGVMPAATNKGHAVA